MVSVLCAAANEKLGSKTSLLILYRINLSLNLVSFSANNSFSMLVKQ